jgi:hypothetical protein
MLTLVRVLIFVLAIGIGAAQQELPKDMQVLVTDEAAMIGIALAVVPMIGGKGK